MIEGWLNKQLIEICEEITDGSHFSPKSSGEDKYPYITVRDISDGVIDFENCKFIDRVNYDLLLKNGCKPNKGDLLFSKDGTVGKVALVDFEKEFVALSSLAILRPKKDIINSEFLRYILLHPNFLKTAVGKKTGVAIRRIILKNLKQIDVNLPESLSEQKEIVAILDKAFESIDKAKANIEKNIQNSKELFQSKLNDIFSQKGDGWEEKQLGEIASVDYGFTDKSTGEGDYRYIRITDIDKNGELIKTDKKFIQSSEEALRFTLKDNDLLMARTGATFAKVLLYKDHEPSVFASYLIKISFTADILNELYWYFTKSGNYWEQAEYLSSGSAQPHFNGAALKRVVFSYPVNQIEQAALVEMIKGFDNTSKGIELVYKKKIASLEELKKSILQKAFNGELTSKGVATQMEINF